MSDTQTAREKLEATIAALGLSVTAVFVPWSKSRAFKPGGKLNDRSLNWKVTIARNGREVLTTDYGAGIGHCPAYNNSKAFGCGLSVYKAEAIEYETEHGKIARSAYGGGGIRPTNDAIKPDPIDVVWSLIQDASVLDAGGFESWAGDLGYDTDSRKAEAIYRECLDLALKLRAALGDEGLRQLQEAGQDY